MSLTSLKRVNKELNDFYCEKHFGKYSENIIDYFRSFNIQIYFMTDKYNSNFEEIYCIKIKHNTNRIILDCVIPNGYPFKPYDIYNFKINNNNNNNNNNKNNNKNNNNNNNYNEYLSSLNSKNKIYNSNILAFFYKSQYNIEPHFLNLSELSCFCCSSIICSNNWNPSLKIDNILLECMEIEFISKYNKPYNYLKLTNIYYGLIEAFEHYKLPQELIDKIFSYII